MEDFELQGADIDDGRAFVAAASSFARYDEAKKFIEDVDIIYSPGARRREASAIAGLEGAMVRPEAFCRVLGDRDQTSIERSARLACDIYDALKLVEKWPSNGPQSSEVVDLFITADASAGRLMRPDLKWTIENDAAWLVEEIEHLLETTDPWMAAEIIRRIWVSGRFSSTSRRMAMIVAAWIIPKGFAGVGVSLGVTEEIRRNIDDFRDAANDKSLWGIRFANAITDGFKRERGQMGNALAAKTSMLSLAPPNRSSSSVEKAIKYCFEYPSFTAKQMELALDLTSRGAKVVLDKLLEANVIEIDAGSRNRKYTCRRTF